jgi:hypothetical protein
MKLDKSILGWNRLEKYQPPDGSTAVKGAINKD